jgi:biotin carboxylase
VSPCVPCVELLINVTMISCDEALPTNGNGTTHDTVLLEHLVRTCYISRTKPGQEEFEQAIKLILVPRAGYLCRKDILELRMRHSDWIETVVPFSTTDGYYPSVEQDAENDLLALLASCPGALIVRKPLTDKRVKSLDDDLNVRLSFDWVLPNKPPRRRVAIIGGRSFHNAKYNGYDYSGAYQAAEALGISVVVVDKQGHWLQGEAYSHLRSEFVAIDTTIDDHLPLRITEAVKDRNVDAIVSFADEFMGPTAQAAEMLGLPTDAASAYLESTDKHAASKLFNSNTEILRLDNAGQLDNPSMLPQFESLHYPLIVKPCRGGGSRGVMKVNDWVSLCLAVRQVEDWGFNKDGILIETYVNGPEVDANFALWRGEILFFEMSDDFPCDADAPDATPFDTFAEEDMVTPSGLSQEEKNLVRSSLHRLLLQLGFHSGIFHVEARIRNSTMCYRKTGGIVDLEPDDANSQVKHPEVFLVEINPRPAGFDNVYGTMYTYGVDFNALHMLRALDDGERFAALSHSFTYDAQYHSCHLRVPIHRENLYVPEDYCVEVLKRLPEVAPYVSRTECFKGGRTVGRVGGAGHIGSFLFHSKLSRRNLLEMSQRIKTVSKELLDGA